MTFSKLTLPGRSSNLEDSRSQTILQNQFYQDRHQPTHLQAENDAVKKRKEKETSSPPLAWWVEILCPPKGPCAARL